MVSEPERKFLRTIASPEGSPVSYRCFILTGRHRFFCDLPFICAAPHPKPSERLTFAGRIVVLPQQGRNSEFACTRAPWLPVAAIGPGRATSAAPYENSNDRAARPRVQCHGLGRKADCAHRPTPRRRFLPPLARIGCGRCRWSAPCLSPVEPRLARICLPLVGIWLMSGRLVVVNRWPLCALIVSCPKAR
jgi:hypothetical protein